MERNINTGLWPPRSQDLSRWFSSVGILKGIFTYQTLTLYVNRGISTIPHRLSLSLWPNFTLTQFLTNHGKFRSYLHKIKKTSSPTCNCPEQAVQTARHLMTECSLFSRNRPAELHNLPPHMFLKHHIHTVSVSSFLSNILHSLLE